MANKTKKQDRSRKGKRKPAVPAAQGVTLGDLLGKKLESVKRESEEKQKKMVKEARNNPAVLKSSEKFAANAKTSSHKQPKTAAVSAKSASTKPKQKPAAK